LDFDDSPEEAAWRGQCRGWLSDNVPRLDDAPVDPVGRAKAWQAIKFEGGFAKIAWEPEFGGCNGTPMQEIVFNQEQARHKVPAELYGLGYIAPTLRAHGTEAQRDQYLVRMLRGDDIWCQMFSEPGAGSDIASLATSAVRDGDEWVMNGQKVWTSHAHDADYGEVLCRTDPRAPKHQGITAFILDLRTPGVTVRPLKQMIGTAEFSEVFLDDVRVPAANVLGEVNAGWHVTMTTLTNERSSLGAGRGSGDPIAHRLAKLARERGTLDGPTRQRVADIWIRTEIGRYLGMRALTAALRGQGPGPEGSVAKLAGTKLHVDIGELAVDILGPYASAGDQFDNWKYRFLGGPAWRIAGGTDEINRNVIAERVLGLPAEPRSDDAIPWRESLR
jgi:alkylation response protein AidB-like acyl-CoA dehydrogenase